MRYKFFALRDYIDTMNNGKIPESGRGSYFDAWVHQSTINAIFFGSILVIAGIVKFFIWLF